MGKASAARVSGPLQPFASGFLVELLEQGYSWAPIGVRLRLMAELSCWLAVQGVQPGELTPLLVEEFVDAAHVSGGQQPWCSPTSVRQLLGYLRGLGLVPPVAAAVVSDPVERLVAEFVEYLVRERGLVADTSTVYEYERTARLFLFGRVDSDGGGLERLTAAEVTGFVLANCRRRSVRMSKALTTSLRGLLRFLYLEALTSSDLAAAVPSVANWRGASLPKAFPAEHLRRLLASCDRTTASGAAISRS
jgi:integrase/recombinase XerD